MMPAAKESVRKKRNDGSTPGGRFSRWGPKTPAGPAPEGKWKACVNDASNRTSYYKEATGETMREMPDDYEREIVAKDFASPFATEGAARGLGRDGTVANIPSDDGTTNETQRERFTGSVVVSSQGVNALAPSDNNAAVKRGVNDATGGKASANVVNIGSLFSPSITGVSEASNDGEENATSKTKGLDQKTQRMIQRNSLLARIQSFTDRGELVSWLSGTKETLKELGLDRSLLFGVVRSTRDPFIIGTAAGVKNLFTPKQVSCLKNMLAKMALSSSIVDERGSGGEPDKFSAPTPGINPLSMFLPMACNNDKESETDVAPSASPVEAPAKYESQEGITFPDGDGGLMDTSKTSESATTSKDTIMYHIGEMLPRETLREFVKAKAKLGHLAAWITVVTEDALKEKGWDGNLLYQMGLQNAQDSSVLKAAEGRKDLFSLKQLSSIRKRSAQLMLQSLAPPGEGGECVRSVSPEGRPESVSLSSRNVADIRVDTKVRKKELREHVGRLAKQGHLVAWIACVTDEKLKERGWSGQLLFTVIKKFLDLSVLDAAIESKDLFTPKQLSQFRMQRMRLALLSSATPTGSSDDSNKLSVTGSANYGTVTSNGVNCCRIFVYGLPSYLAKEHVNQSFRWFGDVRALQIISENDDTPVGTTTMEAVEPHWVVEYTNRAAARAAFAAFHGLDVCGETLSARLMSPSSNEHVVEESTQSNHAAILEEYYNLFGGRESWMELRKSIQQKITNMAKRVMLKSNQKIVQNTEPKSAKKDVSVEGHAGIPSVEVDGVNLCGQRTGIGHEGKETGKRKRQAVSNVDGCTIQDEEELDMKRARLDYSNEGMKRPEVGEIDRAHRIFIGRKKQEGSTATTGLSRGNNTDVISDGQLLRPMQSRLDDCKHSSTSIGALKEENAQLKLQIRESQRDAYFANLEKELARQEKLSSSSQQQTLVAELKSQVAELEQKVHAFRAEKELAAQKDKYIDLQQQVLVADLRTEAATQKALKLELQQKLQHANKQVEKQKRLEQTAVREKEAAEARSAELESICQNWEKRASNAEGCAAVLKKLKRRLAEVERERDSLREQSVSAERARTGIENATSCMQEDTRNLQNEAMSLKAENGQVRQKATAGHRNGDVKKDSAEEEESRSSNKRAASGPKEADSQQHTSANLVSIKQEEG